MSCRHPGDDEFRMNGSPADVGAGPGDDEFRMNGSPAEVGAGPMSADRVVGQAEY